VSEPAYGDTALVLIELRAIRRLLEAMADHNGACVHDWRPYRGRWSAYDQCNTCGKKRPPTLDPDDDHLLASRAIRDGGAGQ